MKSTKPIQPHELAPLLVVDPKKTLAALALDWTIIGVAISLALLAQSWMVSLLTIVVVGSRQHALLILMHEAAHVGLLRRRAAGDWLSDLTIAWPLLVDTATYRANHSRHHRNLNTAKDPDWLRYRGPDAQDAEEWRFPMSGPKLAWLIVSDLLGLRTVQQLKKILLFSGARQEKRSTSSRRLVARLAFYVVLAAALTAVSGWTAFLLYWIVPSLTTLKVLLRVRLIAEHVMPSGADGSRTTLTGPIARFFIAPHNIGYHLEHHDHPGVRFQHLPQLHRTLAARGGLQAQDRTVTRGYLAVLREVSARAST